MWAGRGKWQQSLKEDLTGEVGLEQRLEGGEWPSGGKVSQAEGPASAKSRSWESAWNVKGK